jgi:hypothetical protein
MSERKAALQRSLCARLCDERRSVDELRVIDWVLSGLEEGADQYGPLHVVSDERNFPRERAREGRDSLFYAACEALKKINVEEELIVEHCDECAPEWGCFRGEDPCHKAPRTITPQVIEFDPKLIDEDRERSEAIKLEAMRQTADERDAREMQFDTSDEEPAK